MDWHLDWFGNWHHDWFGATASETLPGQGTDGVGTFVLELQNGYTVTYRWVTDIIKKRSGKEQRRSRNDHPLESYDGKALLLGTAGAEIRTQLAQLAAQGKPFRLGLPHEELTFHQDSVGTTVYVSTTAKSDWMNEGQRVIVKRNGVGVDAIIQSTTATTIVLDIEPGNLGKRGGSIMPSVPILLDPQQAFPRYRTAAEQWDLKARATEFDFARTLATLALGPLTTAAGLELATITERSPGSGASFELNDDAIFGLPVVLNESGASVIAQSALGPPFTPATITQLYTALLSSTLVAPTGTWGVGSLSAADEIPLTELTGGTAAGPIGTGATVTTYAGRPLWDRKLENASTIVDSIHALTQIIDYGGKPYAIGWADMADWGRAVVITGKSLDEFQWLKLFIATVKGRQKSFYLSTWRNELPFVSKAANTITVSGNVGVWWPLQRQHIQIVETSGTITRAEITAAVDNGDNTWTLTIGTTLASSSVTSVSWLEVCRFTSDEFPVAFNQKGFALRTVATVVQPSVTSAGVTYEDDEASDEDSEPRELFTISINDGITVYRHTSASRDIAHGGNTYTAIATDRGPIALAQPDDDADISLLLPIDHPLARRWTAQASPPTKVAVTVVCLQENSGTTDTIWQGEITDMAVEGRVAKFRVPSRAGRWMLRTIPTFTVSDTCVHVLYDSACGVSRDGTGVDGTPHKVTCTVISVNGRDVKVDLGLLARNGRWSEDGEVIHAGSGEERAVIKQTDQSAGTNAIATLTMNQLIPGLTVGDSVVVTAGCDHVLGTTGDCGTRFANRQNYLGWHLKPAIDFFSPVKGGVKAGS